MSDDKQDDEILGGIFDAKVPRKVIWEGKDICKEIQAQLDAERKATAELVEALEFVELNCRWGFAEGCLSDNKCYECAALDAIKKYKEKYKEKEKW